MALSPSKDNIESHSSVTASILTVWALMATDSPTRPKKHEVHQFVTNAPAFHSSHQKSGGVDRGGTEMKTTSLKAQSRVAALDSV